MRPAQAERESRLDRKTIEPADLFRHQAPRPLVAAEEALGAGVAAEAQLLRVASPELHGLECRVGARRHPAFERQGDVADCAAMAILAGLPRHDAERRRA